MQSGLQKYISGQWVTAIVSNFPSIKRPPTYAKWDQSFRELRLVRRTWPPMSANAHQIGYTSQLCIPRGFHQCHVIDKAPPTLRLFLASLRWPVPRQLCKVRPKFPTFSLAVPLWVTTMASAAPIMQSDPKSIDVSASIKTRQRAVY